MIPTEVELKLGVVTALMMFVVPQVVEQFDTVGQELPLLTRMVIALSDFLVGFWWLILLAVALVGLVAGPFNELLSEAVEDRLGDIPQLAKLVAMREELRQLWTRTNVSAEQLVADLQAWCRRAEDSGVAALKEFSYTLRAVRV